MRDMTRLTEFPEMPHASPFFVAYDRNKKAKRPGLRFWSI